MSLTLRCRGPNGQATLSGVEPSMPLLEFLNVLSSKTGVAAGSIELLAGFPPKLIQIPADGTVAALELANGDAVTVRQGAAAAPSAATPPAPAPSAADNGSAASSAGNQQHGSGSGTNHGDAALMDEDEMLARAIAASLEEGHSGGAAGPASTSSAGAATARALQQQVGQQRQGQGAVASRAVSDAPAGGPAPASMPVPGGGGSCVVRRVVASDNSCLFNAVGYVMQGCRNRADELRKVVARTVASDPLTFNDGFLGKEVEEYCRWIQQPDKWGGAIELFILSQHYGREIAAFDIRTKRCDVYGQDKGYSERTLLIYDGLHYDALAVAAFEGAPEELDVTMFAPGGAEGAAIMSAAEKLVAATHAARQFTDTANFTLRCGVCQIGIKGEKEAVEHAKATGHQNFAEY